MLIAQHNSATTIPVTCLGLEQVNAAGKELAQQYGLV